MFRYLFTFKDGVLITKHFGLFDLWQVEITVEFHIFSEGTDASADIDGVDLVAVDERVL